MTKKVLVCITPQSNSKRLIDRGLQTALGLDAELHILHVEKGTNIFSSREASQLLQKLFDYGATMGGIIHGLCGEDIYQTIKSFVREELITHIVVGAPVEDETHSSLCVSEKLILDFPYLCVEILLRESY